MNTILFVWNPARWDWINLEEKVEEVELTGSALEKWTCQSHKKARPGDRAFLAKIGSEPKGIMGAGYIVHGPFLSKHWNGSNLDVKRVLIDFEVLFNPSQDPILTLNLLKTGTMANQHWTPESSGISIRPEAVAELEAVWFDFLTTQNVRFNPYAATDKKEQETFIEGNVERVWQTRYERNPFVRAACLDYHGYKCSVCTFDFENYYGSIGKEFIHVHHLTEISSRKGSHSVDPVRDLRPVCPNCHAMLHKRNPALTIEELRSMIKKENKGR